jgi:hypothetical protein
MQFDRLVGLNQSRVAPLSHHKQEVVIQGLQVCQGRDAVVCAAAASAPRLPPFAIAGAHGDRCVPVRLKLFIVLMRERSNAQFARLLTPAFVCTI